MRNSALLLTIALAILFSPAGCSLHRSPLPDSVTGIAIELTQTPFFPQLKYQCGPAALAMLLGSSGITTSPDALMPLLYIPERHGSLQLEIISGIRRHHRIPYVIRPELTALIAELRAGRPVLVLQNVGLKIAPAYHYAIVIGIQQDGRILLRSGITERLEMNHAQFMTTWERAGSWGVVALRADELPADDDVAGYLEAVAAVEAIGDAKLAEQGYTAFLYQHPHNEIALFGLANTLHAQKEFTTAATYYQVLLKQNPNHAEAANNLAESLASLQCYKQALELLDSFLMPGRERSGMTTFLSITRDEIHERLEHADGLNADCSTSAGRTEK
jgi:tetratricopeptide (TPR) repeat protein